MGISTHVLDIERGIPAMALPVSLWFFDHDRWNQIAHGQTNEDGRFVPVHRDEAPRQGTYRLHFATSEYLGERATYRLYPFIEITFTLGKDNQHLHVPLLLSANGYTTYRGS